MLSSGARTKHLAVDVFLPLAVAAVLAHALTYGSWSQPLHYDAGSYHAMALDFERAGGAIQTPYSHSRLRTYGYPWLLGNVFRLAGNRSRFVVFEFQLLFYLAASCLLAAGIARLSTSTARIVRWAMALNFPLLFYTGEVLTESVSVSLATTAGACWLYWMTSRSAASYLWLSGGALAAGYAVVVRPANIFIAAAFALAIAAALWWQRGSRKPAAALASLLIVAAGVVAPILPQREHNRRFHDADRWLTVTDLRQLQLTAGIQLAKYATAVPPNPDPRVYYRNPCLAAPRQAPAAPVRWYFEHPLAGACTLGIHLFALLDQDFLATYLRDLDPPSRFLRIPLTHAIACLGGWFLFRLWHSEARRARLRSGSPAALGAVALAIYVAMFLSVHIATAVEVRFGLPLYLLLFPLAGCALVHLASRPRSIRGAVAAFVMVYAGVCLAISEWLRGYAPLLNRS